MGKNCLQGNNYAAPDCVSSDSDLVYYTQGIAELVPFSKKLIDIRLQMNEVVSIRTGKQTGKGQVKTIHTHKHKTDALTSKLYEAPFKT